MNQITFIETLDELGLSIMNVDSSTSVFKGKRQVAWCSNAMIDLTYQNRIDIIRECKRKMR